MSPEPVLRLSSDAVSWHEIDGEIVAVDLSTGDSLSANTAAAVLWKALGNPAGATRTQLVAALVDGFGIDTSRAAEDVDGFLALLSAKMMLQGGLDSRGTNGEVGRCE